MDRKAYQGRMPWGAIFFVWAIALLAAAAFTFFGSKSKSEGLVSTQADAITTERLVGRWVRPDGGYVLAIRGVQDNGRLDASYYNPRSINVARAEWRRENGHLTVFIELRDTNYPGSQYTLRYFPEEDALAGTYFQAVHRQTFEIMFVRQQ
ncbi:MAG: hypothetical protein PVJ86_13995 [Phycisphaerales bacterium]|jgi:hypothetical protein